MLPSYVTKSLKILAETVESGLLIEVRMRCSGKFLEWFETLFECFAARQELTESGSTRLLSHIICFLAVVIGAESAKGSHYNPDRDHNLAPCL